MNTNSIVKNTPGTTGATAITLNGRNVRTSMSTLAELVSEHGYKGAKIATAVNGEFVAAPRRATVILQENDSVEIVSARQGG